MSMLYGIIPYEIYNALNHMMYRFPQLVVGVAIVYLGVAMIRGKKVELDEQASYSDSRADNNSMSDNMNYNTMNQDMNSNVENDPYSSTVHVNAIEDKKEGK